MNRKEELDGFLDKEGYKKVFICDTLETNKTSLLHVFEDTRRMPVSYLLKFDEISKYHSLEEIIELAIPKNAKTSLSSKDINLNTILYFSEILGIAPKSLIKKIHDKGV